MTLTDIQRVILELAVEDSFALSELVSRVRAHIPEKSPAEARKLARATVLDLLASGLVEVTRLEAPGARETSMEPREMAQAVADDLGWAESKQWRPHIRVVATKAGQQTYYDL